MTPITKIIIETVCKEMMISYGDLCKKKGKQHARDAKTMAIGLLNEYENPTLNYIGISVGNLNHSTVLHHIYKFKDNVFIYKDFRDRYNMIKNMVSIKINNN